MHSSLLRAATAVSVLGVFAAGAWAAESSRLDPKKPVQKAMEAKAETGKADVKGLSGDGKNSTSAAVEKRAGPYTCDVHIDNRTNWVIHRVYIDGRLWGGVGRYGDSLARDVITGPTRVYAEADFTDGTTRHWGPSMIPCSAYATQVWRLN